MKENLPISSQTTKREGIQQKQILKKESNWEKLLNGILRPPRCVYQESLLGTKHFLLNQTRYERIDKTLHHQNKELHLTIYQPQYKNNWLILYLHGNSSSRLESTGILKFIPYQYSLACFDFMGCGRNHFEETVSLGFRQSQQVQTVMKYLQQTGRKVVIWGRSMGAATALKYGKAPIIIADSSFKSFKSLCKQVVHKNAPSCFPSCLISCIFPCVFLKLRKDIQQRGNYDVDVLNIGEDVQKINPQTMIVFLSADQDNIIDKINSQKLFQKFPGKHKYLEIFKGTHNSKRPQAIIQKVMRLIRNFNIQMDGSKRQIQLITNTVNYSPRQ